MKKTIQSFAEFKRVVLRTRNDVCYTDYGFYYQTKKCDFFYCCRSVIDRMRVFEMLRKCNVKHYKLEESL